MSKFKSRKIFNLWNRAKTLEDKVSILQDNQSKIDTDKKNRNLNTLKKIHIIDSGWIVPILFMIPGWKETWTENYPSWKIDRIWSGGGTIGAYPDPTIIVDSDNLLFDILADNNWYGHQYYIVLLDYKWNSSISGATHLLVDLNNVTFTSDCSIINSDTGWNYYTSYVHINYNHLVMGGLYSIEVKENTILNIDGSFNGNCSNTNTVNCKATIGVSLTDIWGVGKGDINFSKYGDNSKTTEGHVTLTNWNGSINLYTALQNLGYDMNTRYFLKGIWLEFDNSSSAPNGSAFSSNLAVTVTKITIIR
jgi:hypothetical protein